MTARTRQNILAATLAAAAHAAAAPAIDIQLTFDGNASEIYMQGGEDRTLDLIPLFEAAAAHWEEIFLDPYTVQITYWWANVSSPVASNINDNGLGLITANIRIPFDNEAYFLDPTPFDDGEFAMRPYLYRETPVAEQNEAFRNPGTVPDVFEVSYVGNGNPFNDLFTIVLHEIGHVVGLNDGAGPPQCDDMYYDIDVGYTGGSPVGLRIYDGTDCGHLDLGGTDDCLNCQALMWSGQNDFSRTRPGAADILAIANAAGWIDVKLPRAIYLDPVGDWIDDDRWLGGLRPDGQVDAYVISDPPTALIINSANAAARRLVIDGDNDLFLGAFRLSVTDRMTMDGFGVSVNLNSAASELEVNELVMTDDSELVVNAGLVDADTITNDDSTIWGAGVVDVETYLDNRGILQADGGPLWFTTANPGAVFDLDGINNSNGAQVLATTGSVAMIGNFVGAFRGTVTVGDGRQFAFTDLLEVRGPIFLFGGAGGAAINGPVQINQNGSITVDKVGRFLGDTEFLTFTDAFVPNADDILVLEGLTTYYGGQFTGAGQIRQVGDSSVLGNTTIGPVSVYDWDGDGASTTSIDTGKSLTIEADAIEDSQLFDGYDGTLSMTGSTLVVNTNGPWGLCGAALINVFGGSESTIDGSPMQCLGFINLHDTGNFLCETDIFSSGELSTFDAATVANLFHFDNDLLGGLVSGPGTLDVNPGAGLFGFGTVEADLNNRGMTMAEDGLLVLTGDILNPGTIGCATATSELSVTSTGWTSQGGVDVGGGTISGGNLTNNGTLWGDGFLVMGQLTSDGVVAPGAALGTQPGLLVVGGDYVQRAGGTLRVTIGGLNLGSEHDQLHMGGHNSLAGALDIDLINGYVPDPGDEFAIMAHTSTDGSFDDVQDAVIGNGLFFEVQYGAFDVRLVVAGVPCPGDVVPGGGVGTEDLLELLATWGQVGVPADMLPPAGVGTEDLLHMLASWGACP